MINKRITITVRAEQNRLVSSVKFHRCGSLWCSQHVRQHVGGKKNKTGQRRSKSKARGRKRCISYLSTAHSNLHLDSWSVNNPHDTSNAPVRDAKYDKEIINNEEFWNMNTDRVLYCVLVQQHWSCWSNWTWNTGGHVFSYFTLISQLEFEITSGFNPSRQKQNKNSSSPC